MDALNYLNNNEDNSIPYTCEWLKKLMTALQMMDTKGLLQLRCRFVNKNKRTVCWNKPILNLAMLVNYY